MTNRLPPTDEDSTSWHLPQHAHIVVYRAEAGEDLLTIYDCGAAQKPPSAQVTGRLVEVSAAYETERTPTGSIISLRGEAVLVREGDNWRIEPRE